MQTLSIQKIIYTLTKSRFLPKLKITFLHLKSNDTNNKAIWQNVGIRNVETPKNRTY